jgi:hypothetical protein
MRSRQMLARLDRLPKQPEAVEVPDISLLSPAAQDRVHELSGKFGDPDNGIEETISDRELKELERLFKDLPALGPNDKFAGPKIEVPRSLQCYWEWNQYAGSWRRYSFRNLGKVETLQFVELCTCYGWSKHLSPAQLKQHMTPLAEWQIKDKARMESMLEKAARADQSL